MNSDVRVTHSWWLTMIPRLLSIESCACLWIVYPRAMFVYMWIPFKKLIESNCQIQNTQSPIPRYKRERAARCNVCCTVTYTQQSLLILVMLFRFFFFFVESFFFTPSTQHCYSSLSINKIITTLWWFCVDTINENAVRCLTLQTERTKIRWHTQLHWHAFFLFVFWYTIYCSIIITTALAMDEKEKNNFQEIRVEKEWCVSYIASIVCIKMVKEMAIVKSPLYFGLALFNERRSHFYQYSMSTNQSAFVLTAFIFLLCSMKWLWKRKEDFFVGRVANSWKIDRFFVVVAVVDRFRA